MLKLNVYEICSKQMVFLTRSIYEMSAFRASQVALLDGAPRIASEQIVDSDGVLRDSIRPVYLHSLILSGKDVSRVRVSSVVRHSSQAGGGLYIVVYHRYR